MRAGDVGPHRRVDALARLQLVVGESEAGLPHQLLVDGLALGEVLPVDPGAGAREDGMPGREFVVANKR